jgi:tetratricopeptide (TPR) repeat protein/tRNA A-37 threonylcarbamoyl transferase component Bud32
VDLRTELEQHLGTAYTLGRELGGGGMSRVFLAEEVRLGRSVVVKVLSPELAQGLNVDRFEREIRLAASLQQANIVPLLVAGDINGLPYFTMPFVEGESLRARLGRDPLSISEIITVLRDVTRALAYAHARGVVHRDIKPDNVLLSGGAAVVTDFGIAKAISASRTGSAEGATLTQLGTSLGTPAYMSPEQVAGDPNVDHRADLYSLGCVAFELLTGQQPFGNRTPQRMLAAHLTEEAPAVSGLRPDCPPQLAALVARLMAKNPDERPQSAAELIPVLDTGSTTSGASIAFSAPGMFKKALGWYALALIGVAVVAKAAVVGIGLPDWVFPGAILLMALGLPALLATAYVQRVARHVATATPTLTPGGTSVAHMPSGTMATMALKASPHLTWRRTTRAGYVAVGVFALLVGGFMTLRALGIGPWGSLLAAGTLKADDKILVTDFTAPVSDSALGPIMAEAVRAALSQSKAVRPMEQGAVADILQQMTRPRDSHLDAATAREVATRAGASAVLGGRLAPAGTGYVVSMDLTSAQSGTTLASVQGTANSPADLLKTVDKLTRQLRGRMGESLKAVQQTLPLEQATTSSLDALRKYSAAVRASDVEGDYDAAVRLEREALALDSTFALAWRKLANSLRHGNFAPASVDSALAQAVRYADKLPDREKYLVLGSYYGQGAHADRGKAIASYQRAYAADSGNWVVANNLASTYRNGREFDSTLRYAARAYQLQPGVAALIYVIALANADRADSADRVRQKTDSGRTLTDSDLYMHYMTLIGQGRTDSAFRLVHTATQSPNVDLRVAALGLATGLEQLHGQLSAAERDESAQFQLAAQRGGFADLTGMTDAASDILYRARLADGVRKLDAVRASKAWTTADPAVRTYVYLSGLYARAGKPDVARQLLTEFQNTPGTGATAPDAQDTVSVVQGEIALAEGRYPDALKSFREAQVRTDGSPAFCKACGDYNVARVFDRMGQPDSALAYLADYLKEPPARRDNVDWAALAAVQKRLGELYDSKGDTAQAVKHYGAFAELWKNADPDLQPVVSTVKKRMGELTSR